MHPKRIDFGPQGSCIRLKTYRHLYPRIWAWDNLHLAYRKARKGKRGKRPAAEFEFAIFL